MLKTTDFLLEIQCRTDVKPNDTTNIVSPSSPVSDVHLFNVLNQLASKINDWLGFHEGIPRINYGPCGFFAYEFMFAWNQKFQEKVIIVFILTQDETECDHVLVRLPTGELFDGGIGVHHDDTYIEKFKIVDMEIYQHELLEKWSYGLDRTYSHFCPNFDRSKMKRIIEEFFQGISNCSE